MRAPIESSPPNRSRAGVVFSHDTEISFAAHAKKFEGAGGEIVVAAGVDRSDRGH
jgi:hypothetical protein